MIFTLLSHQWKAFWRSRSASKSFAVQLFMGFVILYLLGSALLVGFKFQFFLKGIFHHSDVTGDFCGLILYYFSFDILMRFMVQELPVLAIQPYLTQNVRKRQMVSFLNIRSLFHFLNLLPLLLFLPFIFTAIAAGKGQIAAVAMAGTIVFLTAFNNFIILYLKRRSIVNGWWMVGFFALILVFMVLDYFQAFSIRVASSKLFGCLLSYPWLILASTLLAAFAWFNNYRFLYNNLYLEDLSPKEKGVSSKEYAWLSQWGSTGELIALNIKLIMRNRRPKYFVRFCILLLFYGFIFYTKENLRDNHMTMIFLGALFVTGAFILNFGQFLFAWHSSYFQGLMSANFNITLFIRAQFLMFIAAGTIAFILSTFYGFMNWKILPIEVAAWLYNIGINAALCIYFSTLSAKPIDLNKKATFEYQGTGASQWLFALAAYLLPILLFTLLNYLAGFWVATITFAILGIIGLLLNSWWINLLTRQFHRRKHAMLEGFRES